MRKITLISFWLFAIILIISCNSIGTVSLDNESVSSKETIKKTRIINVTQNEASGIADMFMRSEAGSDMPLTKSADTKRISSSATVREDGQDLMYVFNYEDGGFVIVGSTRNYYPILAYSDKGSFVLKDDMGPVNIWLDETKACIKNSSSLDEATKAQIQNLWARYDGTYVDPAQQLLSARRPQTRSAGEDACWHRVDSLQLLHGNEGWTYSSLSNVEYYFTEWGFEDLYDTICYSAEQNHSDPSETLIGYKYPIYSHVGPLLGTEWHQGSPFNLLCSNGFAGCAAVAAGQVMKYYEYPPTMSWNGVSFNWTDIPLDPDALSKQPHLMRMLGQKFKMIYQPGGSGVTDLQYFINGLDSLGYTVSQPQSHSYLAVRDTLLNQRSPVIMTGKSSDGKGHFWICDGVTESISNQIIFYTENQPYGAGEFTQGLYSYSSPGVIGGTIFYYLFNLNWCLLPEDLEMNGWYAAGYVLPGYGYFPNTRYNIFISEP